jgi:cytochrome P450
VRTTTDTRPSRAPRPRGAPLIGSALDLRRDPLGALLDARRSEGDVVRFVVGPPGARLEFHAVFHPDAVRHVLSREADRFRKDNVFYEEARWALGDGLLNSQDDRWLRQKRLLQPLFTRRRLVDYVPIMVAEADRVVERWRGVAARGAAVDLHGDMIGLSLQVVVRALFGTDADRASCGAPSRPSATT